MSESGNQLKRGRGRPSTGNALSSAERSRRYRERKAELLSEAGASSDAIRRELETLRAENCRLRGEIERLGHGLKKRRATKNQQFDEKLVRELVRLYTKLDPATGITVEVCSRSKRPSGKVESAWLALAKQMPTADLERGW